MNFGEDPGRGETSVTFFEDFVRIEEFNYGYFEFSF